MLKRSLLVATATLAMSTAVFASSVHLKGFANPTFTDNGLTLTASGALAGLGNGDVLINLAATANATAICTNPSGQHQPPGQNPAPVSVSGSEAIPASEVKNGTVSFSVTTNPPVTPIPGAPGCPNKNWTETITDLSFTGATLTVQQGSPPATELTVSCTFSPPTSDGTVPKSDVTCKSK
jgi:hypothetical protein